MSNDVGTTPRRLTTRGRLRIWERDKGVCQKKGCGKIIRVGDKWVCEHLRALELGGLNDDSNLAVFCWDCASEKTKDDHARAAKAKRMKAAQIDAVAPAARPLESRGFSKGRKPSRIGIRRIDKSVLPPLPRRGAREADVRRPVTEREGE